MAHGHDEVRRDKADNPRRSISSMQDAAITDLILFTVQPQPLSLYLNAFLCLLSPAVLSRNLSLGQASITAGLKVSGAVQSLGTTALTKPKSQENEGTNKRYASLSFHPSFVGEEMK